MTEKMLERIAIALVVFNATFDAAVTIGGFYAFLMLVGKLF